MKTTVQNVVAAYDSRTLQHLRRTLELEMTQACDAGVRGTQSHVGQLEMLTAIGAELDTRGHLAPLPAFVDLNHEDGIRFSITVRIY